MRVPKAAPAARTVVAAEATEAGLRAEREALGDEEREWHALLARARRQQEEDDEAEWRLLRERAAEAQRLSEEREWRERIARVAREERVPSRRGPAVLRAASAVVLWP